MKVRNMTSANGNPVPNQFIISDGDTETFQSYRTTIATVDYGPSCADVILDTNALGYSLTTSKYLALFLGVPCAEIRKRLARGEYRTADLNGE